MSIDFIVSKLFGDNAAAVQTVALVSGVVALNVGVIVMFNAASEGPQAAEGTDMIAAISEESSPEQQVTSSSEPEQEDSVITGDDSEGIVETTSDGVVQDSGQDQQMDFEQVEEPSSSDTELLEIADQGILTFDVRVPERPLDRSPYQPP